MQDLGFNKPIKDTKIVVAMSGGIDSSVAAISLKNGIWSDRHHNEAL